MLSLGTDSHHPWQLEFIDLGLAAAAAAGVSRDRILNFKSVNELLNWSRSVREIRGFEDSSKRRQAAS
jgi:histidinol phosphatase-like PHP family hydrolase